MNQQPFEWANFFEFALHFEIDFINKTFIDYQFVTPISFLFVWSE